VKGLVASLVSLEEKDYNKATALEIAAGNKLFNVVVEDEKVGKELIEHGKLKKKVTIIPLNRINAFRVSAQVRFLFLPWSTARVNDDGIIVEIASCIQTRAWQGPPCPLASGIPERSGQRNGVRVQRHPHLRRCRICKASDILPRRGYSVRDARWGRVRSIRDTEWGVRPQWEWGAGEGARAVGGGG
jgi:Chromosome segregation ATPases